MSDNENSNENSNKNSNQNSNQNSDQNSHPDAPKPAAVAFKTWMCLICGWVYDEQAGLPEEGIAPGTLWEDVPMNWTCPECGARKEDFEMIAM